MTTHNHAEAVTRAVTAAKSMVGSFDQTQGDKLQSVRESGISVPTGNRDKVEQSICRDCSLMRSRPNGEARGRWPRACGLRGAVLAATAAAIDAQADYA